MTKRPGEHHCPASPFPTLPVTLPFALLRPLETALTDSPPSYWPTENLLLKAGRKHYRTQIAPMYVPHDTATRACPGS